MRNILLSAAIAFVVWCASLGLAQSVAGRNEPVVVAARAAAPSVAISDGVDLRTVRSQIVQFQQVLNQDLQQTFEHPFALLQDAKGIYLPRFGMAFHMELNLAPLRTLSPFDVRPYTDNELRKNREAKLARIQQLKNHLTDLLQQHAGEFSAVPEGQNVAVVVHLFNLPSEQTDGLPAQLVIEASALSLLDSKARSVGAEEFRKQVTFLEF